MKNKVFGAGSVRRVAGFSLTEMLVVIGIVVVLVGMLIPAIQTVRRSARTTHCLSNVHQIGLALHAYMADQVNFPPGQSHGGYSPHALLLPYIQKTGISSQIDWSLDPTEGENANAAAEEVTPFLCPSDPAKRRGPYGRTSYRASGGIMFAWAPPGEDPISWKREGVFTPGWDIELEDVRDGAGTTAAFSEHGLGDHNDNRLTPESDHYRIPMVETADELRDAVRAVNPKDRSQNLFSGAGGPWITSSNISTFYYHDALPGELTGRIDLDPPIDVPAAKSYHGKGANMLLCDSSARWVKQDIDPITWRALGTFQGEDMVEPY